MLGCSICVSASKTLLSFSSCALNFFDEEKRASFQTTYGEGGKIVEQEGNPSIEPAAEATTFS